jgi:radical SAM superfamily enzyme YgiQ (UPF0313 family)
LDRHDRTIFPEVLEFAERTSLFDVQITLLTPFPGTPLYDRLLRENRILHPGRWELCTLFDVNFQPKQMSPQELRDGLYWLGGELYSDAGTRRRRQGFFQQRSRARRPAVSVAAGL